MAKVTGKVAQIIGPVIDVEFLTESDLPRIHDSLEIHRKDGSILVLEVEQHVGQDTVRCIAMDSTDGLSRGYEVIATGNPIQMPIGDDIYGRLFNVTGNAIDGLIYLKKEKMVYLFTVKHQNLMNYQLQQKFYLQVSK